MEHKCVTCGKTFASVSSLNNHRKTAKYCLELQEVTPTELICCEFCDKSFTSKYNLTIHLATCKSKQEYTNKERYERMLEQQRLEHEKQLLDREKQQRLEREKQLLEHEKQLLEREKQIELREQQIQFLKQQVEALQSREKDLTTRLIEKPTVYNDNSTTTNYTIQFNKLLEELVPYTPENIKKCVQQIEYLKLMDGFHHFSVDELFNTHLVDKVKVMAFCSDQARGKLVTKLEDGSPNKISAEQFILNILNNSRHETAELIKNIRSYASKRYIDTDYSETMKAWEVLYSGIIQNNNSSNPYIRKISNNLSKHCKQLAKSGQLN